jgi:hypothetical protein
LTHALLGIGLAWIWLAAMSGETSEAVFDAQSLNPKEQSDTQALAQEIQAKDP